MKKKLGRPRKKEGVISDRHFQRAGIVMSFYNEARKNGQKHSAAVAQTVEFIKQRYPMMRISETGVKRLLAVWRPRGSRIIYFFAFSKPIEKEPAKHYSSEAQLSAISEKKGAKLPTPSDVIPPKLVAAYEMRFGERPNYLRHNRKPPKE